MGVKEDFNGLSKDEKYIVYAVIIGGALLIGYFVYKLLQPSSTSISPTTNPMLTSNPYTSTSSTPTTTNNPNTPQSIYTKPSTHISQGAQYSAPSVQPTSSLSAPNNAGYISYENYAPSSMNYKYTSIYNPVTSTSTVNAQSYNYSTHTNNSTHSSVYNTSTQYTYAPTKSISMSSIFGGNNYGSKVISGLSALGSDTTKTATSIYKDAGSTLSTLHHLKMPKLF